MSWHHIFAFAAAALLWAMPAAAWSPEVVGLDDRDLPGAQVTLAAVDGTGFVTPEVVGSARLEAIAPNDTGSSERLAHHCTCK